MSNKFVTIQTCPSIIDVEIIKGKLESEGIKCFIDSGVAGANPLLTVAVGWIKVNVMEKDAARFKIAKGSKKIIK